MLLLLLLLLCCCFGPIKITLSNYLKPMLFCFSIIFLRTAERIFHRVCVSYKLEQNVCVLPLLLACFVALWLPYKYFCFSYVCFFKKQMSTIFRSIFAFVRLNDYYFPLFFVIWVIPFCDNELVCLLSVFVCFDSNHFTLPSLVVRACFVLCVYVSVNTCFLI